MGLQSGVRCEPRMARILGVGWGGFRAGGTASNLGHVIDHMGVDSVVRMDVTFVLDNVLDMPKCIQRLSQASCTRTGSLTMPDAMPGAAVISRSENLS